MLASYYKQTFALTGGFAKYKVFPKISFALKAASMIAFLSGVFLSYYVFFGAAALLALGITFNQIYFSATAEYLYTVSDGVLYFEKINVLGKVTLLKEIPFGHISSFGANDENRADVLLTDAADTKKLIFEENGRRMTVVFSPDTYLSALIIWGIRGFDAPQAEAVSAVAGQNDSEEGEFNAVCSLRNADNTFAPQRVTSFAPAPLLSETTAVSDDEDFLL
ncbi:MAG: hypothetical protein LBC13_03450 [Clostridiales bacterium]|jgi:hypothetical protein|nr:hypothetical protein [Clostridiales bacterium]